MKLFSFIRPTIFAEVFTNLAAGWFGILLISPSSLIRDTGMGTIVEVAKAVVSGILFLILAELMSRKTI